MMEAMRKMVACFAQSAKDMGRVFWRELRQIARDQGVLVFFLLVPLAYPLIYASIYTNEVVRDVPVAVVDDSRTSRSRDYLRRLDASPDVKVAAYCANMDEARRMLRRREAYGIVYLPREFNDVLVQGGQAYVNVFCDMSGLLYYKSLLSANTYVSLGMNADIKMHYQSGAGREQEETSAQPIDYEEVGLYNPQNGFAAFLLPAVLVLIVHQTLLLGIGMSAGTASETGRFAELAPVGRRRFGLPTVVIGRALAYMLVYIPVSVYVLGAVPRLFRLPHLGSPVTLAAFALPFLLATIFFALTVSVVMRRREACMLLVVFTSVPLLFISGISWPRPSIPAFWQAVSWLFPSTFGINGYVRINSMGASLPQVAHEWCCLWGQAALYFLTACWACRRQIASSRRLVARRSRTHAPSSERSVRTADSCSPS